MSYDPAGHLDQAEPNDYPEYPDSPITNPQEEPQVAMINPVRRKLTLTYSRTVQARQFEPATVSATMEADLPDNCTLEEAMAVYENEMILVKAAVLSQQGLSFELSETENRIMEVFPDSHIVQSVPAQMPAPTGNPFAGAPAAAVPAAAPADGMVRRTKTPTAADLPYWEMLVANPGAFWDNRGDKPNPNAPDFKLKVDRGATPEEKKAAKALWLNQCPDQFCEQFGVQI